MASVSMGSSENISGTPNDGSDALRAEADGYFVFGIRIFCMYSQVLYL